MSLLGNGSVLLKSPARFLGAVGPSIAQGARDGSRKLGWFAGTVPATAAIPGGYGPAVAWSWPLTAGDIACRNEIDGLGELSNVNLAGGINMSAALAGSGSISNALLTLLLQLSADLAGTGTVTADIDATADLEAALAGSGSISAAIDAIANLTAALTGTGSASGDIDAVANLTAALAGTGTISSAALALIVPLVAALTGTGSVSASISAPGNLTAALAGSGSVSAATLTALGNLVADLVGTGTVTADIDATANISADIVIGDSDPLSPANLAAAVWNALVATYDATGSFGEAIGQGSAGLTQQQIRDAMTIDPTPGTPTAESIDLLLLEIYRLLGLDPTRPLVVTETSRDAGAEIEQTVVEAPAGTITVTRIP